MAVQFKRLVRLILDHLKELGWVVDVSQQENSYIT